ncbi:uncharacterized protein LOC133836554 [Drosophila sulfurigaster albostrigata]|uniref:uncharacterized protein LOC133836554 n=1 Tax=Drosophila sulfurigaster albostrigata TaxID=89887 RepID=UPI002D21DCD3|nr:uncharacterized protein LOC133836554 [Drosophila sulfurigaster albostrigata]
MTTRICVYRDCHNFYSRVDNSACSDVTLFSFPKDAKRAELWRLLGQVHPKIGAKQLYMCSKHFDSKYLSVTKHRTTLIGEALPIAYENAEDVDDPNESAELSLSHENVYIKSNDNGNIEICSPKKATKTAQSFYIELDDDQLTLDNVVLLESTEQLKQINVVPSPTRKRPRSPSPAPPSPLDDDDQQLLDASEVQTIIVKGKHYVQMPREYYVQEKRQMLQQLQQYKEILSNIRQQLKPLDDL